MTFPDIDYGDIQGLVRFGHGHLKAACFFVLQIVDAGAARSWLAERTPTKESAPGPVGVTTAVKEEVPDCALQVAFTYDGLEKLGLAEKILKEFSYEFRNGMAGEKSRSRRLGDVGTNDPALWEWGHADSVPHVLVMVYATPARFEDWKAQVQGQLWNTAFRHLACLSTDDNHDKEPFGFADGLSQPAPDWERRKPTRLRATRDYTNLAALGEFLLGYPNEYGRYTDRPLLDESDDPQAILPPAEDQPAKRDFGRNGTFLVVRDLAQDVPGFWQFIDGAVQHNPLKREELAYAMVGRRTSGDPIVSLRGEPIVGVADQADVKWRQKDRRFNQFTFDDDPDGTTCPVGAHIRRANPRNADLPAGTIGLISRLMRILGFGAHSPRDDLLASTRFHRLLRRGREYGPELTPEKAIGAGAEKEKRGLRFICLNANIARQFEFIQTSWIANPNFLGADEDDPLLGNRASLWTGGSTDTFMRPQDSGLCLRTPGLRQFVTVRGGAYFFLPGISTLRYLARAT